MNSSDTPLKIAVSAGELSGDQHLAHVVRALSERRPIECRGMGGDALRSAGVETVVDCYRHGSAMGFFELIKPLAGILRSLKTMKALLAEWRPDFLLLVDYPDFNMRLARAAFELGIPVYWFIPPKIWVWRRKRIELIKKWVSRVGVIFPFEETFYRTNGYENVDYVGHPVSDAAKALSASDVEQARLNLALKPDERLILLLPGSRPFEVERILRPMLQAVRPLLESDGSLRAAVVAARSVDRLNIEDVARQELGGHKTALTITTERADVLMRLADAGLLKSGTCNLEAACAGLPFVCVYSGTHAAKWIARLLLPIKEFSPVNIMKAGTIREIIEPALDPTELRGALLPLLENQEVRTRMKSNLQEVASALDPGGDSSSERAARAIITFAETR